jgi:serine/threonine-protein kinase
LCNAGAIYTGGSWGEDGIIAALEIRGGLSHVSADGGNPTPVTSLDPQRQENTHRLPQILPGGKAVLFTTNTAPTGLEEANIEVMSLADHRRKTLYRGGSFGRYVPSGHLIFVRSGAVFAVPFDLDSLEVRGTPVEVLDQVNYVGTYGFAALDFSGTPSGPGMAVLQSGAGEAGTPTVQWLDSSGKLQPLVAKRGFYSFPRVAPDGERVALVINSDLYVYDPPRETMTRLTFSAAVTSPLWTPDSRYIVFYNLEGLESVRSDGASKPQPFTQPVVLHTQYPTSFTPDGKRLLLTEFNSETSFDISILPVEIEGTGLRAGRPEVFQNSRSNERDGAFSPDGRWIAYSSDESGVSQIYVRAYPDRGVRKQVSGAGGYNPLWSPLGNELWFRSSENRLMVAKYSVKGGEFIADKPNPRFDLRVATQGSGRTYDLSPDGKRVVALMPVGSQGQGADNHVTFLLNFFDELRRRAPTDK